MQRRHIMPQRSPILPLLVAATVAVDAVVIFWVASEPYPDPVYAAVAFHAAMFGQLSVLCIWSSMREKLLSRMAPFFAVVLAGLLTATLLDAPVSIRESIMNHVVQFGLHAVALIGLLWLLQRTAFWRRRTGITLDWQYSIAHLLLAMTLVAVLATLMRNDPLLGEEIGINIAFTTSSVTLAVVSVVVWSLAWHWFLKLAAVLACAVLFALALLLVVSALSDSPGFARVLSVLLGAHYAIQGLILSIWLALAPILPVPPTTCNEGR